jgi:DNA polymerase III epsilon subunit family exonuclease
MARGYLVMLEELANLLNIDKSDPSTGIKISLKQRPADPRIVPQAQSGLRGNGETEKRGNVLSPELPLSGTFPRLPVSPQPNTLEAVHVMNGRVIRESRHADSAYSNWAPIVGPAEVEVERKSAGGRRKTEPPIALEKLEYVVVDVETTGGPQLRGHRITEISMVRVDANGRTLHEYSTLINPERTIPAKITQLTNIHYEMVRHAPRFGDVADDIRAFIGDRVFVAHNAAFDWGFIHGEMVRTTGRPLLGKRLCTVRLARKVVPEVRRRSLDALSYYFNVHNEARHRAYGDARATAIIFQKMLDRVYDREISTWQALDKFVRAPKLKRKRSALPTPMEEI